MTTKIASHLANIFDAMLKRIRVLWSCHRWSYRVYRGLVVDYRASTFLSNFCKGRLETYFFRLCKVKILREFSGTSGIGLMPKTFLAVLCKSENNFRSFSNVLCKTCVKLKPYQMKLRVHVALKSRGFLLF